MKQRIQKIAARFFLLVIFSKVPSLLYAQPQDALLSAMQMELKRSFDRLKNAEKNPLYFLGYQVIDARSYGLTAFLGAVQTESDRHERFLDVDVRIGERRLDNTHQFKGKEGAYEGYEPVQTEITLGGDEDALKSEIWWRTDRAYKDALNRYTKVLTNKAVTAEEEDKSDDFSEEKPSTHYNLVAFPDFDKLQWRRRLSRLSRTFRAYPFIFDSGVFLAVELRNRYFVNSEGANIVAGAVYMRLSYRIITRTEDGMDLERYRNYDADRLEDLPSDQVIKQDMLQSVQELKALRLAPLVEPFTGPAIIRNRATGVYFHEILGHRLEGHRQKSEEEGQTFKRMLGKAVVAPFISVYDDPTLKRFQGQFLRGHYLFDHEGVPSQALTLIENGVLKNFLMSRSPIAKFPHSNGHGRRSAGYPIVARMGSTIVKASKTVSYAELRAKLIEEIKRQNKPYGMIFEDIAGGFTGTGRSTPQSFKVLPLLVWRVYPDGRPDEAVRGADIVGTPLTSFGKITAAADDYGIFNGTCGAESGWVPVSAVAPSILISEMEVEKKQKSSEKPPILPAPLPGEITR